jgi:ribosome-associated protein
MNAAGSWTDDGRLAVSARVAIPADEITVRATRAGGPGGQHVNTSSTRVEVTWCVATSRALDDGQRARLRERLATKLDARGTLRVVAADTRSQTQNRELALRRMALLIKDGLAIPKVRRPTAPTRASVRERLETKQRRASQKRERRWRDDD